MFVIQPPERF